MRKLGAVGLVAATALLSAAGALHAQVTADDNGEESFIRQAIPKLLGRQPKGALEVRLLLDVDAQVGRAAVVRSLMDTDEFVDHWADVVTDMLRMQRIGDRAQDPQCFGLPHQTVSPVNTLLAAFVRDEPADSTVQPPGGAFNMTDLIRSAIKLDDLSPIYRAYPVPLTWKFNPMVGEASVGDAFNHAVLNREPDCMLCHNSSASVTGNANSASDLSNPNVWVRTWPAPFDAETSLYDTTFRNAQQTRDKTYPVFRIDQIYDPTQATPTLQPGVKPPWGMVPECGQILPNVTTLTPRATHFANLAGNQIGLIDLTASIKSGSDALKTYGLPLTSAANGLPIVAGDRALAYLTAEKIVEGVWKEIMGSPLTIANYFPRNQAQRDTLLQLTDNVFDTERWSLRALIAAIMTGSSGPGAGFFNRTAPDVDSGSPAYRLPLTFDPWVQKDPRLADPMPDPSEHFNGQGELVHRYSVQSLLHAVAVALDWPEPQRFPPAAGSGYPDMQLEQSLGQFISDDYQGRDGVDFQGLLSWESKVGACDKSQANVATSDWINRLTDAVAAYNAANPTTPLTVADVEIILKDWLTGEAWIDTTVPTPLDPAHAPLSEAAALAAIFGVSLTTPTTAIANLESPLRRACGALVESPQFMLAGIKPIGVASTPKLRVCNAVGPCSYEEMCHDLVHLNGYLVVCGSNNILIVPGPNLVCPPNTCVAFSSFGITLCEASPGACGVPFGIPGLTGPPLPDCVKCGLPWVDLSEPTGIYLNLASVTVQQAAGAEVLAAGSATFAPLRAGMQLGGGAILRMRGGSVLALRSAQGMIHTPVGGMPVKNLGALSVRDRGLLDAVQTDQVARVEALLRQGANANARDSFGRTALMSAAARNDVPMMTALLAHGANPFARSPMGLSATDMAAQRQGREAATALARIGVPAKPAKELAHIRPDTEEPWYVFVGAGRPVRPKPVAVTVANVAAQRRLERQALTNGGEAGPALTDAQMKAALAQYMSVGFALEHPARTGAH